MEVIKNKYGDTYREGFGKILNPNDHPKHRNEYWIIYNVYMHTLEIM